MILLSPREQARQIEQQHLDSLSSSQQRNRSGQFSTPFPLAQQLAAYVKTLWDDKQGQIRFLEPSVGTGTFYSALQAAFKTTEISEALGIEIDPLSSAIAHRIWAETGLRIVEGDFTKLEPAKTETYNLILANPPYVRHHHLSATEKTRLRGRVKAETGYSLHGLAGLYC